MIFPRNPTVGTALGSTFALLVHLPSSRYMLLALKVVGQSGYRTTLSRRIRQRSQPC